MHVSNSEAPRQTEAQNQYAAKLFARLGEAVMLQRVEVNLDGWRPKENECHRNASEIHLRNPSYTPVRGWLYFDFGGLLDRVQILAHSAVRTPDGELCDVTPSHTSRFYPFIPAEESEEGFAALVEGGVAALWHIK